MKLQTLAIALLAFLCMGAVPYDQFKTLSPAEQCSYKAWVFEQGILFRQMGFMREYGPAPTVSAEEWARSKTPNSEEPMFLVGNNYDDESTTAMAREQIILGWDMADEMLRKNAEPISDYEARLMRRAFQRQCADPTLQSV